MILSAGLGTRLRPLTERWPKPAMPFLGQPLFRYHLAVLARAGVSAVGINTHHLPEVMAKTAEEACARLGLPLTVVHEPIIQGTGGGIRGLQAFLSDAPFVVMNGDILFSVDLKPVVEAHVASKAAATLVLLPMPEGERYAAVETNSSHFVRRIAGIGPGGIGLSPWHFTGVHVMSPDVFDFMSASGPEDINRDVYPRMLQRGLTVRGHVLSPAEVYWSDLGTPERYLRTVGDALFGHARLERFGDANPLAGAVKEGLSWRAQDVQADEARISGPAYLAPGAVLEGRVDLGAAVVVGRNARLGAGCRLNRVAVMDDAVLPPDTQWEDCIVWGEGERLP